MPEFREAQLLKRSLIAALFLISATFMSACGRYGKPLPPEYLAPSNVQALEVTAALDGVKFNWQSPDKDRRGKDLKSIDGYKIFRKEVPLTEVSEQQRQSNFAVVSTLTDNHLVELEKRKAELLSQDKPARKLKANSDSTKFSYTDNTVVSGKSYLYRVIPFNQGGVLGQSKQTVRVLFSGASSQIGLLPSTDDELESEDLFN